MTISDIDWLLNSSVEEINSGSISLPLVEENNTSIVSLSTSFAVKNPTSVEDPYYIKRSKFSSLYSIFDEPIILKPGSVIVVSLAFFIEHSGIYIGNDQVVELYGDGSINLISLKEFLYGGYKGDFSPRTGINVFAASYQNEVIYSEEIALRAKELIGKTIPYNIFKNNCHMFSGYCFTGKNFQKNTDCKYFYGLTKKIMDSTIKEKEKVLTSPLDKNIDVWKSGFDWLFKEYNYLNGGFSKNDINDFSWKIVKSPI